MTAGAFFGVNRDGELLKSSNDQPQKADLTDNLYSDPIIFNDSLCPRKTP